MGPCEQVTFQPAVRLKIRFVLGGCETETVGRSSLARGRASRRQLMFTS